MTNDKKNGGFNKKVNSSKSNSTKGLKSDLKSTRKKLLIKISSQMLILVMLILKIRQNLLIKVRMIKK